MKIKIKIKYLKNYIRNENNLKEHFSNGNESFADDLELKKPESNKRFNRSQLNIIRYSDISFQDVWDYYHSKLRKHEIIYIKPLENEGIIEVAIKLDHPLQLHYEHRLVFINKMNAPIFLCNNPKKKLE